VTVRRAVLAAPEPVQAPLLEELQAVETVLSSPSPTKDEADALAGKITALASRLRSQESTLVRNEIQRFKDAAALMLEAADRSTVDAQVERALSFVAGDNGAPDQARHELRLAQGLAAERMRVRLDDLLDDTDTPLGMTTASWATLTAEVRDLLAQLDTPDSTDPLDSVRSADRHLLAGLVAASSAKLKADLVPLEGSTSPADQSRAAALTNILNHLSSARKALAHSDLASAHTAFDEARAQLASARKNGFFDAASVTTLPRLGSPPSPPGETGAVTVPAATIVSLPIEADVRHSWQWNERLLACATVVIGVLLGLQVLYVGKPTWGSPADILVALLWGAGLSQVAGAAHQGYSGVRTAVTS
jgi:hypothetical protein